MERSENHGSKVRFERHSTSNYATEFRGCYFVVAIIASCIAIYFFLFPNAPFFSSLKISNIQQFSGIDASDLSNHDTDSHKDQSNDELKDVSASNEHPLKRVVENYMKSFVTTDSVSPTRLIKSLEDGTFASNSVFIKIRKGKAVFEYGFDDGKHVRMDSLKQQIRALERKYGSSLPDVDFVVQVHDGNKPPDGVVHFGSAKHWKSWTMIPVPIGSKRGANEGFGTEFSSWERYIRFKIYDTHHQYPWESKIEKALFRGNFAMQTWALGSCNNNNRCEKATSWRKANRGVMYLKSQENPELFDVQFTSKGVFKPGLEGDVPVNTSARMRFVDFQKYKYIINVGSNQDWAERLRNLLFTNSVILVHQAETVEWFYPFLKPLIHYIPIKLDMSDLVEQVEWAKSHDQQVQKIVKNANRFAWEYLTENFMCEYWFEVLSQYSKIQQLQVDSN